MMRLVQYWILSCGFLSAFACPISQEGLTWHFTDEEDTFIPGIEEREQCFQICLDTEECKGYTFKLDDLFGGVCILFKTLGTVHECVDCKSGAKPAKSEPGTTCPVEENILASMPTEDDLTCLENCGNLAGCMAYTWFNENGPIKNMCFLLSSCDAMEPCDYCSSGTLNCLWRKECYIYNVLFDVTRNVNRNTTEEDDLSCDKQISDSVSIDWQGSGWYRQLDTHGEGTRLPEMNLNKTMCGAEYPGWLQGEHPSEPGTPVDAVACFGENCTEKVDIQVLNCGSYFTYNLHEPKRCNSRYCTTE